jgi:voltage-gated potassium channel
LGSTVALVAIYYLLPLDNTSIGVVVGMLVIGLLSPVVLITFQVRSIIKATYPPLRAVGALATSVPLFLLLFAATLAIGGISVRNFSEPLTRTDALYFTSQCSQPSGSATSRPRPCWPVSWLPARW